MRVTGLVNNIPNLGERLKICRRCSLAAKITQVNLTLLTSQCSHNVGNLLSGLSLT